MSDSIHEHGTTFFIPLYRVLFKSIGNYAQKSFYLYQPTYNFNTY